MDGSNRLAVSSPSARIWRCERPWTALQELKVDPDVLRKILRRCFNHFAKYSRQGDGWIESSSTRLRRYRDSRAGSDSDLQRVPRRAFWQTLTIATSDMPYSLAANRTGTILTLITLPPSSLQGCPPASRTINLTRNIARFGRR